MGEPAGKPLIRARAWIKPAILLGLVLTVAGVFFAFRDRISLAELAQHEAAVRSAAHDHPWLVFGTAFLVYVIATSLALPIAVWLSLAYGWLFGFWPAVLLVSCGSASGACLSLLLSRYLLRDWVQLRFGNRLNALNAALSRDGWHYLLALRLNPVIPYYLINVLMGLTEMPLVTFWWVSQLGMLPATCIFVNAGASLPSLEQIAQGGVRSVLTPRLFLALFLLSLFPLIVKRVLNQNRVSKK